VAAGAIGSDDMTRGIATLGLARGDRVDLLRQVLATVVQHPVVSWASSDTWCGQAEAAAVAGDRQLGLEVAGHLGPLTGRMSISGISVVMGPVDGYLSLALAASGRADEAREKAEAALVQAAQWGLTAYVDWLRARRALLGY